MDLTQIDPYQIFLHLCQVGGAFLIAFPIGWERERHAEQPLGFRTLPLVAMTSCAFVLIGKAVLEDPQSQARVLQGVITGIGFLGGGAIVKQGLDVYGTSTAAAVWTTAALGVAVAYGRLEIAISLSLVTLLVLRGLRPVKEEIHEDRDDGE